MLWILLDKKIVMYPQNTIGYVNMGENYTKATPFSDPKVVLWNVFSVHLFLGQQAFSFTG